MYGASIQYVSLLDLQVQFAGKSQRKDACWSEFTEQCLESSQIIRTSRMLCSRSSLMQGPICKLKPASSATKLESNATAETSAIMKYDVDVMRSIASQYLVQICPYVPQCRGGQLYLADHAFSLAGGSLPSSIMLMLVVTNTYASQAASMPHSLHNHQPWP